MLFRLWFIFLFFIMTVDGFSKSNLTPSQFLQHSNYFYEYNRHYYSNNFLLIGGALLGSSIFMSDTSYKTVVSSNGLSLGIIGVGLHVFKFNAEDQYKKYQAGISTPSQAVEAIISNEKEARHMLSLLSFLIASCSLAFNYDSDFVNDTKLYMSSFFFVESLYYLFTKTPLERLAEDSLSNAPNNSGVSFQYVPSFNNVKLGVHVNL